MRASKENKMNMRTSSKKSSRTPTSKANGSSKQENSPRWRSTRDAEDQEREGMGHDQYDQYEMSSRDMQDVRSDHDRRGYQPHFSGSHQMDEYGSDTEVYPGMRRSFQQYPDTHHAPYDATGYDRDENRGSWSRQSFMGKGPKGYQRSDERIKEDVCEALSDDEMLDASAVEVEVSEGIVSLSGTVASRHDKRLAEDALSHVRGIKDIQNDLRLNFNEQSTRRGSTESRSSSAPNNF